MAEPRLLRPARRSARRRVASAHHRARRAAGAERAPGRASLVAVGRPTATAAHRARPDAHAERAAARRGHRRRRRRGPQVGPRARARPGAPRCRRAVLDPPAPRGRTTRRKGRHHRCGPCPRHRLGAGADRGSRTPARRARARRGARPAGLDHVTARDSRLGAAWTTSGTNRVVARLSDTTIALPEVLEQMDAPTRRAVRGATLIAPSLETAFRRLVGGTTAADGGQTLEEGP